MSVVEVIGWMIQFGEFVLVLVALMMRISKKSTDITLVGLT
ncbi:putative holin-like toxin [Enterococcus villorum]|uniref:Uncharacterized protein n=1 Tax=Enterococcus villorum TaxID=112904 RepID=A0A511J3U5_9ENTE|nr:putative holin-like toxin [Enterococcus villorum]GEL92644.1 hypothetical protein EVI01_19810 [Enterococcus villorum]